jgi:hypothetical protein
MAGVTRYLGDPVLPPYVNEQDLMLLAADVGAGWKSASDLYDWYAATVRPEGREPVTKKWFGLALAEAGLTSSTRRLNDDRDTVRCWLITRPWVRRGEELLAQERTTGEGR